MNLKTWFSARLRESQTAIRKAKDRGTDAESIAAMEAFERFTQTFVANELWKPRERTEPEGNDSESEGHQWLREQEAEALREIDALLAVERQKGDGISLSHLESLRAFMQSCFSEASVQLLSNPATKLDPKIAAAMFEAGTHYQDARLGLVIWAGEKQKRAIAKANAEQLKEKNRKPKPTRDQVENALRKARSFSTKANPIIRKAVIMFPSTIGRVGQKRLRDLMEEYGLKATNKK